MSEPKFRVYGYRWVVLAVFMFINLTIQMLWTSYAPITGPAAQFYGVTDLQIGLLAVGLMAVSVLLITQLKDPLIPSPPPPLPEGEEGHK